MTIKISPISRVILAAIAVSFIINPKVAATLLVIWLLYLYIDGFGHILDIVDGKNPK
jgi:hypothetical protein